jgi:mRNA interferase HigB
VRVIAKRTIHDCIKQYPDAEKSLLCWFKEASESHWKSPNQIKRLYRSASVIPESRVVFNIKGNHYRLVVKLNYAHGIVWVRFFGTHADYDKINASTI